MIYEDSPFLKQANLMVECLPVVFQEECFALKGGTAINLFLENFPRLSVDIDLVYLPIESYEESQIKISEALNRIAKKLEATIPKSKTLLTRVGGNSLTQKLNLLVGKTGVVIEPNFVIRGTLEKPKNLSLCGLAQEVFQKDIKCPVLTKNENYAGKFCAALDRQHPRDLFDVKMFFEKSKIDGKLMSLFISYLLCTGRPLQEVLFSTQKDISVAYEKTFKSMTPEVIPLNVLLKARTQLVSSIHANLTEAHKNFLISFAEGSPKWDLLDVEHAKDFPGIQWKLQNIQTLKTNNPAKLELQNKELVNKLRAV